MARRIARGLFRLWIVLSVLWVCAVGAVAWWTFPVELTDAEVFVPDPPFDPDAYLAGKPQPLPDAPWVVLAAKRKVAIQTHLLQFARVDVA
jgi:hypothetical protein